MVSMIPAEHTEVFIVTLRTPVTLIIVMKNPRMRALKGTQPVTEAVCVTCKNTRVYPTLVGAINCL